MSTDFPFSTGITAHHTTYPFIAPSKLAESLVGKVVLITGASRGIGRETALAFAASGASVAALARTTKDIELLVAEIKAKYPNVKALAITGSVLDDAAMIVAEVEARLGSIDILVNNAGMQRMNRFAKEKDLTLWWETVQVNLLGPMSMIHAVLPGFIARKSGVTITVGSAVADISVPFMSAYQASKAGLMKAIQSLDAELRPQGIFNFVIHPGAIATELSTGSGVVGEEMKTIMKVFDPYMVDIVELPAWSMVALAALVGKDERVGILSGRYLDVTDDLGELLEKNWEIEERGLYHLRIRKL